MRQVIALSALLALALGGSYLTWTDESVEIDEEAAVVYTASEADLQQLSWKSEDSDVVVEQREDERGSYLWVTATERKEKLLPPDEAKPEDAEEAEEADDEAAEEADDEAAEGDDGEEAEAPEEPPVEIVETTRSFLGNKAASDMWTAFAPLTALRELATGGELDASAFGLDEPTASLEVVRGSGPIELKVGGETYGSKDRYVGYGGKVFLVDDQTVRPLQYASSRLIERSLFPMTEQEIAQVDVEASGQQASFVQKNRDDRAAAFWARAGSPDSEDDVGGTWLGKVFRLKLKDYVGQDELPADLEPVVTYRVQGDDQAWTVTLLREPGDDGAWYARSDYNRSVVSLTPSLAQNVVDDLESLFDAPAAGDGEPAEVAPVEAPPVE